MDSYQLIAEHFQRSIETIALSVDEFAPALESAAAMLAQCLINDGKIIACGSGSDAALAQLLVANFIARQGVERPPLPAMTLSSDAATLTAITALHGPEDIYARQIRALGNPGDTLFCINSAATDAAVSSAIQSAYARNMRAVVLSNTSDRLADIVSSEDVLLRVALDDQARLSELHIMMINCLVSLVDQTLFGTHQQE